MEEYPKLNSQELAEFNGQDDKPTYVAYNGRIIDLSTSKRWPKGKHMNRHQAGHDLSADLASAPTIPRSWTGFPRWAFWQQKNNPRPITICPPLSG